MVTGENAEAAGGNGEGFVQAEFGGKIGDRILVEGGSMLIGPGILVVKIAVKIV